jgi:hypothetical protein
MEEISLNKTIIMRFLYEELIYRHNFLFVQFRVNIVRTGIVFY